MVWCTCHPNTAGGVNRKTTVQASTSDNKRLFEKQLKQARWQWLMYAILATWSLKSRKVTVPGQPTKKVCKTQSQQEKAEHSGV
jgi:hypothetical protein